MKRKNKQVIRLASIALMSAGLFGVSVNNVQATDDHEGPKIESVTLNKSSAKPGDTVHIVTKVSDMTGTKNVELAFVNGSNKHFLTLTKKDSNTFEGDLKIDKTFANGNFSVTILDAEDDLGNTSSSADTLSTLNITGSTSDIEGPKIESVTLNKSSAKPGDTVHIVTKVSDMTGTKNVELAFVNGSNKHFLTLTKKDSNTFEGDLKIDKTFANGNFSVTLLDAEDDLGNSSSSADKMTSLFIYSDPAFDNINDLKKVTVFTQDDIISNSSFNGDVYIAPNATVHFNNVKVSGNIYVLGGLYANSVSADSLYFLNMSIGGLWFGNLPNGQVVLSGNNSISNFVAKTYPLDNIPFRIDGSTPVKIIDGKVNLKGVYANVADAYLNDHKIKPLENGKFVIKDLDVGNAEKLTLKFVTVFGNTIEYNIPAELYITSKDGKTDAKPTIKAGNIKLHVGDKVNFKDYASATDKEDGDLTSKIKIDSSNVDTEKAGNYNVVLSVTDKDGATTTKKVAVVVEKATPTYTTPTGLKGTYGAKLSSIALPSGFKWDNPDASLDKVGQATYTATYDPDSSKYNAVKNIKITVDVAKANTSYTTPTGLKGTYGAKLSSVSLPSGFKWDNPDASLDKVGQASYTATYDPDSSKYNAVKGIKITVDVAKANTSYTTPTGLKGTYGAKLSSIALPSGFKWDNPDASLDKVGQATYTATYDPDSSKYNAVKNIKITIDVAKANTSYTTPTGLKGTYGTKLSSIALPSGFKWDNPNASLDKVGQATYTATYDPDSSKYNAVKNIKITVDVAKANTSYTTPTGLKGTYGAKLSSVSLPSGFKWDNPDATLDKVGQATYTATYDPDSSKYNAVKNIKITVDVAKANTSYTTPTGLKGTYGAKLSSIALPSGFKWDNPNAPLDKVGQASYTATYDPDSSKYNAVKDIKITVDVAKANTSYTMPTDLKGTYGAKLSSVSLPSGFKWDNPDATLDKVGQATFTATYDPDSSKYNAVKNIKITVDVAKANTSYTTPTGLKGTYGAKLSTIALPSGFKWDNPDATLDKVGQATYTATYDPDPSKYNAVKDIKITVDVAKAKPVTPTTKTLSAKSGAKLSSIKLPVGYKWVDGNTVLKTIGTKKYKAIYNPDSSKYESVAVYLTVQVTKASSKTTKSSKKPKVAKPKPKKTKTKKSKKIIVAITSILKLKTGKKSFVVTWKKVKGASGYQVRYTYKKNLNTAKAHNVKSLKYTAKKLKSKKKYYVQVRTFKKVSNKTYYAAWSKIKTVKVK